MFLDDVVRLSGLSPIFASRVIRRAVQRAGLDPDTLARRDFETLEPELERALRVYLGDGATARLREMKERLGV
jgi:hypothetical protein